MKDLDPVKGADRATSLRKEGSVPKSQQSKNSFAFPIWGTF